ncbi:DapH/DapD/GlmU-related protein [Parapedobacter sp. 2B3]|uniref:acyltransferase n=1 Tax=Parapedobacter sp. 2B3 TaxID=3342381 RepID=UPI0035B682E8
MKRVIEWFIKKRNPKFAFDKSINTQAIIGLFFDKSVALLRAILIYLFHLKVPRFVFIGPNVSISNFYNIEIGKWTKIDKGATIIGLGRHKLIIGNSCSIGAYSQIITSSSFNNLGEYVRIGNRVGIGQFASLGGSGGLEIQEDCIIGQYFSCHPENHLFSSSELLIKDQGTSRSKITIESNCWIGAKVTVLAGVTIGSGCVVAAGSVVTKSMPANSIIAGVPAKVLKSRY